jgi:hypothetical protein
MAGSFFAKTRFALLPGHDEECFFFDGTPEARRLLNRSF